MSNLILLTLEKAVDGYVRLEDFMYNPGYYAYQGGWGYALKKSSLAKQIKRLREKGLIDFTSNEQINLKLTDEGWFRVLTLKLLLDKNSKWDGKWRLVVFDIPEKRRVIRDTFRNKLKDWGFVQKQQSVWITKRNCADLLKNYVAQAGIKDWVMVLEADHI